MKPVDEITVGIVSWYDADLIENLIINLTDKTSGQSRLNFLICDNTNGADTDLYDKLGNRCQIIAHDQGKIVAPSYGHAKGLNVLLANVTTDLCLLIDPDCWVLMNHWDVVCKASLSDRVIAIGAPYPPTLIQVCHGHPVAYFMLFKASIFKEMGINWSPYQVPLLVYVKDFFMRNMASLFTFLMLWIFGPAFFLGKGGDIARAVFGCSSKETGWRLFKLMRKHAYSSKMFTNMIVDSQLRPECRAIEDAIKLANRFQLYLWDGLPIVTHLGSTVSLRNSISNIKLVNRLARYFRPIESADQLKIIDHWQSLAHSIANQMEKLDTSEVLKQQTT